MRIFIRCFRSLKSKLQEKLLGCLQEGSMEILEVTAPKTTGILCLVANSVFKVLESSKYTNLDLVSFVGSPMVVSILRDPVLYENATPSCTAHTARQRERINFIRRRFTSQM